MLFECIFSYFNDSFSGDDPSSRSASFVCVDPAMIRVYDAVVYGCIVFKQ